MLTSLLIYDADVVLDHKYSARRTFFYALAAGNAFERKCFVFILEHSFFRAETYAGEAAYAFILVDVNDAVFKSCDSLRRADGNADAALGAGDDFIRRIIFYYAKFSALELFGLEINFGACFFTFMTAAAEFIFFANCRYLHTCLLLTCFICLFLGVTRVLSALYSKNDYIQN